MNKHMFIEELEKKTGYSKNRCILINDVLESNFLFKRENSEKIINDLVDKCNVTYDAADKIYQVSMSIIGKELNSKIKHPFKNQDA